MKRISTLIFLILWMTLPKNVAKASSLGWWFLPDAIEDLPLELEEDDNGLWSELWVRPGIDSSVAPNEVMEQTLASRWVGLNPDKDGRPTQLALTLGNKYVEFSGEAVRFGSLDDGKLKWSDNSSENLYAFRRHRRRRRSVKIKFGKMTLPPLASKTKVVSPWGAERLPALLNKVSVGPGAQFVARDLSVPAQIYDANSSFLNLRFSNNCSIEARTHLEDVMAQEVEPRLTCWMSANPQGSAQLLAALLQRPVIDCKSHGFMPADACGMTALPRFPGFFPQDPKIYIPLEKCKGEVAQTLLHEILHLASVKDKDMDPALETAESCRSSPANLEYENENEGFFNDFEIQTRIFIFRKVRDESVEKWRWTEGERDFMLGTICSRMGDKYCSRNYFQKAVEDGMKGFVTLPEGNEVTWSALAEYQYYDSITEELQRLHELSRYLKKDPNGTLLRRIETGTHRLHEFFVARQALEMVIANKGVCNTDVDEHILCEDLAEIVKTPWFKHP